MSWWQAKLPGSYNELMFHVSTYCEDDAAICCEISPLTFVRNSEICELDLDLCNLLRVTLLLRSRCWAQSLERSLHAQGCHRCLEQKGCTLFQDQEHQFFKIQLMGGHKADPLFKVRRTCGCRIFWSFGCFGGFSDVSNDLKLGQAWSGMLGQTRLDAAVLCEIFEAEMIPQHFSRVFICFFVLLLPIGSWNEMLSPPTAIWSEYSPKPFEFAIQPVWSSVMRGGWRTIRTAT